MAKVPYDIEAEHRMIGSLVLGAWEEVISAGLTVDWFWDQTCSYLFKVMEKLDADGKSVDEAMIRFAVIKDGKKHLNHNIEDYINKTGTKDNWPMWMQDLRLAVLRRKAFMAAMQLKTAAENADGGAIPDVIANVDNAMAELREEDITQTKSQKESVQEIIEMFKSVWEGKKDVVGYSTGYIDYDRVIGGMRRCALMVLAGRPGMGKTALALNIALRLSDKDIPVGIFSLEMSRNELNTRLASIHGKVDTQSILQRKASESDLARLAQALKHVAHTKIQIDDTAGVNVNWIRQRARRMVRQGAKVIIVDYLQLVRATNPKATRNDQVAEISVSMKAMAKELDVPVLALCQMNREFDKPNIHKGQEVKRRPRMSDLRDSGSIEQDADSITFIYDDNGIRNLAVAKNRTGPEADIPIAWFPQHTRFENISIGPEDKKDG